VLKFDNHELSYNTTYDYNLGWVGADNYLFDNTINAPSLVVSGLTQIGGTSTAPGFYVNPSIGNTASGSYYNTLDNGSGLSTFNGPMHLNNNLIFGYNNGYSIGSGTSSSFN